jgi:hypothetical protein
MRTFSAPAIAALSAPRLRVEQLILMEFPSAPIGLNSSNRDFVYGGLTYRGAAGLGTVGEIDDSPGDVKGLQFTMSGVPSEYLALALGDATEVQGAPVTVFLAIFDENWQIVEASIDWTGRLDTMPIQEDGDTCTIAVTAESSAVDLLRGSPLTYSNVDQWSLYPGDRAFEYVPSQSGKPIVWGGKQWQIALARR